MDNTYLSTLTPEERREISLCGITLDQQLAQANPDTLYRELQTASQLLPGLTSIHLTRLRLNQICQEAAAHCQTNQAPGSTHHVPQEELRQLRKLESTPSPERPKQKGLDRHPALHPITLLITATLILLLALSSLGLILESTYLVLGIEPPVDIILALSIYAALWLLYLVSLLGCRCIICRGRMCSFFTSKRSVHAHYIPLLGHTIPAACSILFTGRTICPHCGTLQLIAHCPRLKKHH